jgi:hypothetical protein
VGYYIHEVVGYCFHEVVGFSIHEAVGYRIREKVHCMGEAERCMVEVMVAAPYRLTVVVG